MDEYEEGSQVCDPDGSDGEVHLTRGDELG